MSITSNQLDLFNEVLNQNKISYAKAQEYKKVPKRKRSKKSVANKGSHQVHAKSKKTLR